MDRDSQDGHPTSPEGEEPREVLTIVPGETICLGDEIRVRVVEVRGNAVSFEIIAPPELRVGWDPQKH